MLPKVILTTAWAELEGFSDAETADFFTIDKKTASRADKNGACPRCHRVPNDCIKKFSSWEPSVYVERIKGVDYVVCLCGTVYYIDISIDVTGRGDSASTTGWQ